MILGLHFKLHVTSSSCDSLLFTGIDTSTSDTEDIGWKLKLLIMIFPYQEVFFENRYSKIAAINNAILTLREAQRNLYS